MKQNFGRQNVLIQKLLHIFSHASKLLDFYLYWQVYLNNGIHRMGNTIKLKEWKKCNNVAQVIYTVHTKMSQPSGDSAWKLITKIFSIENCMKFKNDNFSFYTKHRYNFCDTCCTFYANAFFFLKPFRLTIFWLQYKSNVFSFKWDSSTAYHILFKAAIFHIVIIFECHEQDFGKLTLTRVCF